MKKTRTFSLVAIFIFLVGTTNIVLADKLQDGVFRYKAGEYDTAYELLLPLATDGNPAAQAILGVMYEKGQGVSQNFSEATKWYRLSADQGYACLLYTSPSPRDA